MHELEESLKKALEVIEKLDAKLPDDTYLDKFVSGVSEKTKDLKTSAEFEDFLTRTNIDQFCARNFSGNEEIQNFTFKLCSICCARSEKWNQNCSEWLKVSQKWPSGSTMFLQLMVTMFNNASVEEDLCCLAWSEVLSSAIQSENGEKSHFWKSAAKSLIVKFVQTLLYQIAKDPHFLASVFESKICIVLRDNVRTNSMLTEAIAEASEQIQRSHIETLEKIFPDFSILPLEAQVRLQILENSQPKFLSKYLCEVYETTASDKVWIRSLKILYEQVKLIPCSAIEDKCLELSLKDYKLIQSLSSINSKSLAEKLWNVIFENYLQSFLDHPENLVIRDFNDTKNAKMMISLLSSLNLLIGKVERISDSQWTTLTRLTMISELDPMTRSSLLDFVKKLLDSGRLVNLSLETLASQLWHLLRYQDWETRDAVLYCFSSEKLNISGDKVPKALIGLVKSSLSSDSSFVRKAALILLSKLWRIECGIITGIHQQLEAIMLSETEAIVRRQAAIFTKDQLDNNDAKTVELMLLATKDLDWEVKQISFTFWRENFDKKFRNGKYDNFDEFVVILNKNRILEGLQLVSKDYEKALQNECFLFLKMAKSRIMKKFPRLTRENLVLDDVKRPKLESRDFLVDFLFDHDLEGRIKDYYEYCEKHYGLMSILDDINHLGSQEAESQIDTIDCF